MSFLGKILAKTQIKIFRAAIHQPIGHNSIELGNLIKKVRPDYAYLRLKI